MEKMNFSWTEFHEDFTAGIGITLFCIILWLVAAAL